MSPHRAGTGLPVADADAGLVRELIVPAVGRWQVCGAGAVVLGAGQRIFLAPLTIEPVSTTVFSGGAVAHVFAAHP